MPLGISLNSNIFQAGSILEGSVYFDIDKEVSAKECVALLEGYEIAKVEYEDVHQSSGDTQQQDRHTRMAEATRRLIQMNIPLDNDMIVNNRIQAGRYQMKFQVNLPEGLPSSMEATGRSFSDQCSIAYEIRAQLKGSGWISDYKAKQPVTIVAKPLQKETLPFRGEPVEKQVRSCCCWNRGQILFGARVQDTMLDKGESVKVCVSCKNHTNTAVTAIQATLQETLEWSAQSHREFKVRTLATVDFLQFSWETASTTSSMEELQEIQKELENGTHSGTVVMPTDAYDTFAGKLISCQHTIKIVVKTGCCIDNPEIEIPVKAGPVQNGRISQPSQQQPPADFVDGANISEPVACSSPFAVLGGSPYEHSGVGQKEEEDVVIPPSLEPPPPSMALLFKELDESINDYDLVKKRVNDRDWETVFDSMTPADYGKVIKMVDSDFDQPKVAECIAEAMASKFSCDYCVAAVRVSSDYNRSTVVEKVLPYCVDLSTNKNKILSELSDWEKTVTERAFANALKGK